MHMRYLRISNTHTCTCTPTHRVDVINLRLVCIWTTCTSSRGMADAPINYRTRNPNKYATNLPLSLWYEPLSAFHSRHLSRYSCARAIWWKFCGRQRWLAFSGRVSALWHMFYIVYSIQYIRSWYDHFIICPSCHLQHEPKPARIYARASILMGGGGGIDARKTWSNYALHHLRYIPDGCKPKKLVIVVRSGRVIREKKNQHMSTGTPRNVVYCIAIQQQSYGLVYMCCACCLRFPGLGRLFAFFVVVACATCHDENGNFCDNFQVEIEHRKNGLFIYVSGGLGTEWWWENHSCWEFRCVDVWL